MQPHPTRTNAFAFPVRAALLGAGSVLAVLSFWYAGGSAGKGAAARLHLAFGFCVLLDACTIVFDRNDPRFGRAGSKPLALGLAVGATFLMLAGMSIASA